MKLTKRERTLITLLIGVAVFYGYLRWIIIGQHEKLADLEAENQTQLQKMDQYEYMADSEPNIDGRIQTLNEEIEQLHQTYFTGIVQEDLILLLNGFIETAGLPITRMEFTPLLQETVDTLPIDTMKATLSFEGEFHPLLRFLEEISTYEKKISIENIELQAQPQGLLTGKLDIRFYSLPAYLFEPDNLFAWNPEENTEIYNPFSSIETTEETVVDSDSVYFHIGDSRVLLEGFETDKNHFTATGKDVRGSLNQTQDSYEGNGALQVEYQFSRSSSSSQAQILLEENVELTTPPDRLTIWSYAYGSGDARIKIKMQDANKNYVIAEFASSIDWSGWKQLTAQIPQNLSQYPMKIVSIIIEGDPGIQESSILLFDGLEAVYPAEPALNPIKGIFDESIHYQVQSGDTLEEISRKFYGHAYGVNQILSANGLQNESQLQPGKKLVIPMEARQ